MNTSYGLYPVGEPYLYDVLERKLEKRSEKGWMADYVGVFFIKYKKCEPKRRKVQIVYDPDNVEYQTEKSEYSQGLEYYIEDAGWMKACDYFKQKIYYNDDPDAVPIETDDRVKLETIKESMVGLGLITYWTLGFMFLFGLMFGGRSYPGNRSYYTQRCCFRSCDTVLAVVSVGFIYYVQHLEG